MNKLSMVATLLVFALLVSACQVRVGVDLDVQEDGSGTLTSALSFNEEFRSLAGNRLNFEELEAMIGPELPLCQLNRLVEGEFAGVEASCTFGSVEELRSVETFGGLDSFTQVFRTTIPGFDLIQTEEGFRFSMDVSEMNRDLLAVTQQLELNNMELLPALDLRWSLTLPGEIVSHNAQLVQGNTLTWTFPTSVSQLAAESRTGGGLNTGAIVALVAAGVAVAAMVFFRMRSSRPITSAGSSPQQSFDFASAQDVPAEDAEEDHQE